ncbi:taste receptor type 2 member 7-like [Ascaphus truei]|uniref:taste receptor type 2 member 7-like n=1 Tax=Ascaphus truei TaxID=8439 RepID=UPI003F593C3E
MQMKVTELPPPGNVILVLAEAFNWAWKWMKLGVEMDKTGTITCIAGTIFNSCIMAVSYRNWRKDTSHNLCDLILLSIGLSNVVLQCIISTQSFLLRIPSHIRFYRDILLALTFLDVFLVFLSFWLTAWLCVYYCIKISNFMHRLFFRVKLWVSSVLQKLLLMSAVGSFIISVPSLWLCRQLDPQENSTYSLTANCSAVSETTNYYISNITIVPTLVTAAVLGCCLPFLLSLTSIGLTLTSLWGHVWRMKQKTSDVSIPRLQVHSRAARNMILLVVLSMSMFLSQIYPLFFNNDPKEILSYICLYTLMCYPTAQAFLLILGNTKLRRTPLRSLSPRAD